MRTIRAIRALPAVGLALVLAVNAAAAQAPRRAIAVPSHATSSTTAPQIADDEFELDDALLAGIDLSQSQRGDIVGLRRLQVVEQQAGRPLFLGAVDAMRRAQQRGDDMTAGAIMGMIQTEAQSQRTWRLAAIRALLTLDQRRRFDANTDALMSQRAAAAVDAPNGGADAPI